MTVSVATVEKPDGVKAWSGTPASTARSGQRHQGLRALPVVAQTFAAGVL